MIYIFVLIINVFTVGTLSFAVDSSLYFIYCIFVCTDTMFICIKNMKQRKLQKRELNEHCFNI